MLKVDLNHGRMSAFDFSGTITELSADLVLVFQLMYNEIRDKNGEEGKEIAEAFAGCVKSSIERAEKTADDIKKFQGIFNEKMGNLIEEMRKAMSQSINEEKDSSNMDFIDEFHKFLYGEDDK